MPSVFLSYSHADLQATEKLGRLLRQKGITVWRDQQSLYGGQQWPKAIGEAIAAQDFFLLLWSQNAKVSHFVEFEWTTAIALRKRLIPYLLDDTPLPSALQALQGVKARDLSEASLRMITALQTGESEPWSREHAVHVFDRLEAIRSTEPEQVASQAKTIFDQEGWTVKGNVYQAKGNMYVTILPAERQAEPTKPRSGKSFFETWIKVVGLLVALCALAVAMIVNWDRLKETFLSSAPTTLLRGVVIDIQQKPIADATVEIRELRGKQQTTTSDGGFYFPKVPGKPGDRARVFVKKPNYRDQNEYVTLPGPVRITLKRADK